MISTPMRERRGEGERKNKRRYYAEVGRPKHCCRDDIVGQQGAVWTRIAKKQRKMEDSGGGLLPAVEGYHSLE